MSVQGIHGPMEQGLVHALHIYLPMAFHSRVVHPMIVVKTDVLAGEEILHLVGQDDILRYTAF